MGSSCVHLGVRLCSHAGCTGNLLPDAVNESVPYPYKDTAAQEGVGHWAIVPGVCGIERIVSLQPYMARWYLRHTQGTMTASTDPLAARHMQCILLQSKPPLEL